MEMGKWLKMVLMYNSQNYNWSHNSCICTLILKKSNFVNKLYNPDRFIMNNNYNKYKWKSSNSPYQQNNQNNKI